MRTHLFARKPLAVVLRESTVDYRLRHCLGPVRLLTALSAGATTAGEPAGKWWWRRRPDPRR
jgi:hypothetical protein